MTRTSTPRKRFGQHFLAPEWVTKVVAVIKPQPDDTIIEVGPGRGALTHALAARARKVIAFEIDRDLVRELQSTSPDNVTIVEGDFLDTADRLTTDGVRLATDDSRLTTDDSRLTTDDSRLTTDDSRLTTDDWRLTTVRVAANLPYNVASPILFKLVALYSRGVPLVDATVMLQREVADRLNAAPGGKDYGVLSVLMQHAADVRLLLALPPGAFRPPPKVRSAVVQLRFHPARPAVKDPLLFEAVVQAVFTRRRKTLANALLAYRGVPSLAAGGSARALERAGLDGTRRPETLSVDEFARLADAMAT